MQPGFWELKPYLPSFDEIRFVQMFRRIIGIRRTRPMLDRKIRKAPTPRAHRQQYHQVEIDKVQPKRGQRGRDSLVHAVMPPMVKLYNTIRPSAYLTKYLQLTLVVTQISSRGIPDSLMPSPTSFSFPYPMAVSTCR